MGGQARRAEAEPELAPASGSAGPERHRHRRWLIRAVKMVLAVLVVAAVGRHVVRTWNDLRAQGRSIHIDPGWLAVAVGLYLAGLCGLGVFFWRVLQSSATPVRLYPALRAYLISHLGKYVPGKAMVVVLRATLVTPFGARLATAAFATLYETLVMMAAGGLLAAAGFWMRPIDPTRLAISPRLNVLISPALVSLAMGAGLLALAWPSVVPRLLRWVSLPFPGVGPESLPRFSGTLLGIGLAIAMVGWCLLGLSQVAVVRAIEPAGVALASWPLVIAGVALATVAGFAVAILPGGLGVRELIIMTTLAPAVGADLAVIAALVLRLAWVAGEVLAAMVVALVRPSLTRPQP